MERSTQEFTEMPSGIYIPSIFNSYNLLKENRTHVYTRAEKDYKNSYFSFTLFPKLDVLADCLYLPCQAFTYTRWAAGLPCYANMFTNYIEISASSFNKVLNDDAIHHIVKRCYASPKTQLYSFKIKDDYWSVDKGAIFLNKKLVGLAVYKIHVGDLNNTENKELPNLFTFLSSTYLLDISLKDTHKKIYSLISDYIYNLRIPFFTYDFTLNTAIYHPNSEYIIEKGTINRLGDNLVQVQYCSGDWLSQFYTCSYNE